MKKKFSRRVKREDLNRQKKDLDNLRVDQLRLPTLTTNSKKKNEKIWQSPRILWHNIKCTIIQKYSLRRKKEAERIFEETVENFSTDKRHNLIFKKLNKLQDKLKIHIPTRYNQSVENWLHGVWKIAKEEAIHHKTHSWLLIRNHACQNAVGCYM